jgi:hypothetical protein
VQFELFPWQELSGTERSQILGDIRRSYWHVRNLRGGKHSQAALRSHYRKIADQKKRLQLAGVERREILDFLSCCRTGCRRQKCLQCVL